MLTKLDRADGIAVLKFGLFSKLSVFRALGTFWNQKWKSEVKSWCNRRNKQQTH